MASEDPSVLLVGTRVDQYVITEVLGRGGLTVTYLVRDEILQGEFILKEFFPEGLVSREGAGMRLAAKSNSEADYRWCLKKFYDEARLLAQFNHPNIVNVRRVFEANDTAYLVMDFIRGSTLEHWLRGLNSPPSQEELDLICGPLLKALELMHENRALHLDISPQSLIIRDNDGAPILLGSGAMRFEMKQYSTLVSAAVFKSGYSAPEQYTSDANRYGPWTDIYAFGCTLYRAVSGSRPMEATSRQLNDEVVPAARVANTRYRDNFLKAIDWAMKLRPDERPRSVSEWRKRLLDSERPRVPSPKAVLLPEAANPKQAPTRVDRRWLAMALLGGIAMCALPLALLFQSGEDAVLGSLGTLSAGIASFSRDQLPLMVSGSRWNLSAVGNDEASRGTYYAVLQKVEFSGRRLDHTTASDWQHCATVCLQTKDCTSFTFAPAPVPSCELKTDLVSSKAGSGISGVLFHGTPNEYERSRREGSIAAFYKISVVQDKP